MSRMVATYARPSSGARCSAPKIGRQAALLADGTPIVQETRHWHEDTGITTSGREKSDAEDYRYFPEPDLVPVAPSREWVEELREALPEPPRERRARLQQEWGFSDLEMRDTVGAGALGLVEETIAAGASPQSARKWWLSELARRANEQNTEISALPITPADVADKIRDGKVQAVGALIGQVMKEMRGQADAGAARGIILAKLGQS